MSVLSGGSRVVAALAMLAATAVAPDAGAQEDGAAADTVVVDPGDDLDPDYKGQGAGGDQGPDAGSHREGDYGGVTPGAQRDRKPAAKVRRGRPVATWIGFQPLETGGSRFFVQLSAEASFDQAVVGNQVIVTVDGARFGTSNTRRRLDTRFFATPVREVNPRAVRRGRGIQLVVDFKNPADARAASARMAFEPDGYHYLYLEFGAGAPAAP